MCKCQGHFKVKYLKLFIIANYAMTPCCKVFIKVRVISRSNTEVRVISRSNIYIHNNYLRQIKCCEAFVIQLKVKCQGHLKVKYFKLFIIANYAMTPCCEVFTMVKVKCQGHFKVKYLKMFIMNNFATTPCCEAFTNLKVI